MTPSFMVMYTFVLFTFIFWVAFMVTTPTFSLKGKGIKTILFGFPNIYQYFLSHYIFGWPIISIITLCGSIVLFNQFLSEPEKKSILFSLATLFLAVFSMSFFRSNAQVRYTFHLYPMMVIIFSFTIVHIWRYLINKYKKMDEKKFKFVTILAFIMMLFISQDANPIHARQIANREYTTPTHPLRYWTGAGAYSRFHQDVETPSLYIKDRFAEDDLIIAMGEIYHFGLYHWYTGKVDYVVISSIVGPGYFSVIRNGKEINYITGSRIIRSQGIFEDMLQSAPRSVWLIGDKFILDTESYLYTDSDRKYFNSIITKFNFIARDNVTFVAKLK